MDGMSDKSDKRERSLVPLIMALILSALPILYVLSAGPADYLSRTGLVDPASIDRFYTPLYRAERRCPPFGRVMEWYGSFWFHPTPQPAPPAPNSTGS